MPNFSDDISTPGVMRGGSAVFGIGVHGEANFDSSLTGRRKAQSLIVPRFLTFSLPDGADVTAFDFVLGGILFKSEIIAVQLIPEIVPAGGTKTFTVDLHKGNSSTAYATTLSGTAQATTGSTARAPILATIDSTKKDLAAGDSLKLVGTVGGAGGTNVQGGVITVLLYEHGSS